MTGKKVISDVVGKEKIAIHPTTGDPGEKLMTGDEWFHSVWLTVVKVLPPAAVMRFLEMYEMYKKILITYLLLQRY